MNDFLDRISKLSPKRLALLALEQHEQLQALQEKGHDAIAIVGMGCRYPGGATSPDAYWRLLNEGRDAIREVPTERWDIDDWYDADPDAPARMSARAGGFLDEISRFDPSFFGISPREALTMDPQQRLLLEVSWEALENAGISPASLHGTQSGVFVGICNSDHFNRLLQRGPESIDAYVASGSAHSVAAGRISYFLGLQGPALSIDTACSSSLVALHAACTSLRNGEARLALAAGVNVMCSPETTIALSKAHMLAPDGRCKTFDASADGFSRGEGCGVLVLKRLPDAIADGDAVLAVIRGSAVNQDGHSGGLTVPNGPAQEAVIRAALADAGVQAADIDYVEAHGTGTSLGDPIEVRALSNALGAGRTGDRRLQIGSVKTNIGHLESAAGIAGVMKVVLSLMHERIPPHLHFSTPSPHIPWHQFPVDVTAQGRAWSRQTQRKRLAGVSSFGFSGTNAHVVIEEAPVPAAAPAAEAGRMPRCLPLSARTPVALSALAASVARVLRAPGDVPLEQVARTLGIGRAPFEERLAVVAATQADAASRLEAFANGAAMPEQCFRGTAPAGERPEVVFLFTGQGSQYPGMGRQLYAGSAIVREVIDRCDELLGADAQGRRLKDVMWQGEGDCAAVHETAWTQPALFAIEYALTQLWRSWGIEPAAVIGHSVGEYVAACVAGVMTLEEGLRLMAARGRLMQGLPAGGAMAAVFAPLQELQPLVDAHADQLAIAAVNAPDSVVISGAEAAVMKVLESLAARNVQGHRLKVALAAHSPLVEPLLDEMQSIAGAVISRKPQIPVAWNLGVDALPGNAAPDARYWRRHMREPVHFAQGMQWLREQGFRVFLEVGPHPTLSALAQRASEATGKRHIASLRRGQDEWSELVAALAQLHVAGVDPDWGAVHGHKGVRASLPTYPFERRRFWIDAPRRGEFRVSASARTANGLAVVRLPTAAPLFEGVLAPDTPAWLGDHVVQGAVLVAGPVMLQLARDAFVQQAGAAAAVIESFSVHAPLVLSSQGSVVQVLLDEAGNGFSIHAREQGADGVWVKHASGIIAAAGTPATDSGAPIPLDSLRKRLAGPASGTAHYERLEQLGIELKGQFRTLGQTWRRDGEALAEVALVEALRGHLFDAHPVLLDGALQAIGLALPGQPDPSELFLFNGVEQIHLPGAIGDSIFVHVVLRKADGQRPAEWIADLQLRSPAGALVGQLRGVALRRTTRQNLIRVLSGSKVHPLLYHVDWEASPIIEPAVRALCPPAEWLPPLRVQFNELVARHNVAVYDALLPELDRLSIHHASAALQSLGFDATRGRTFTTEAERVRLGVVPAHARLFGRLLQMLGEEGVLREQAGKWEVTNSLPLMADVDAHCIQLIARFTGVTGELSTLRRCGPKLAQVLRGEQDPLQLLFPGGSFAEARELYVESPYARCYNGALVEALKAAIRKLPAGAKLRVLEVGAGTGGTTSYALPALPRDRVEYTFTDLSGLFLDRARERFGEYPGLRTARLDIEKDPFAQGFERAAYDVVIAANVLHATADLALTMTHVRELLAPGGLALMLEGVAPERWVDLTFGLTDGWWRFTDPALRPDYPLISRDAWLGMLGELSFTDAATVPGDDLRGRGLSQQALIVARAPQSAQHWLLVGGPPQVSKQLAGHLRNAGHTVRQVAAAEALPADSDQVVHLEALDWQAPDARSVEEQLARLARHAAPGETRRVWVATRGAQGAREDLAADAPMQAQLWGLGRVFSLELPERWGGLVDLSPHATPDEQSLQLYRSLTADEVEDQSAWRDGERLVPRIAHGQRRGPSSLQLDSNGIYLVTGGFGGLGLVVARWLAAKGARHVALLGRNPDMRAPALEGIRAHGAEVIPVAVDVADVAALDRALAALRATGKPLRGILHAAAHLGAAPLANLTAAEFHSMNRPKVEGTLALHRLTREDPLEFMVLFSSTTALFGAAGMAHYAAANQFMDAFARQHDRSGRRVLSVNWGTWEVMRLASVESQQSFRDSGLNPMPADAALEAMEQLLADTLPDTVIAEIDWEVLKPLHEARRRRPLYERMVRAKTDSASSRAAAGGEGPGADLARRLGAASGQRQKEDVVLDYVSAEVANVLHLEGATRVSTTTGLFDLGMDSLMAVELRRRLEAGTGLTLPSTLTFNYPTAAALAGFLLAEMVKVAADAPSSEVQPEDPPVLEEAGDQGDLNDLSEQELELRLMKQMEKLL